MFLKSKHTYGEIPDSIPSKSFFPLGNHLWKLFQELGWDYFNKKFTDPSQSFWPEFIEFLDEKFQIAVETSKRIIAGAANPESILSTWFYPPVVFIRSDLQKGTTKLIYGNSTDLTFVLLNDATQDPEILINGHMEEGLPADYWYLSKEHELLDRKHDKTGTKLVDIPRKYKDFVKSASYIMDILKKDRAERSRDRRWV